MNIATLTDNFELRVPDELRESMHLTAGAQFHVIPYAGRLEFIPIRKPGDLRGFARGMDTTLDRDPEE